jgi:isoleucyl-tRNA synthetase
VEIKAAPAKHALLGSLGDDLKFVLITSSATVSEVATEAEETIVVTPSAQQKCERCWHYRADVGSHPEHPGLCGRCVANLFGGGEDRHFA